MSDYDLVIRGGTVVTASDTMKADVGIRAGRIVAVAESLTNAAKAIDASGLLVMPGGIDSHVHMAQPAFGGPAMADGFESGTRSAIAGGTTTVLPFALQPRGASLRASVMDYHKEADGQSYCDYGFHLIVSDPSASVLGQELPALVADGYTSFKVFMTYDDLVLNDRQLLEVFDCARGCGALVMVHCEGYDAIRFMTERLERAGKTAPYYHAISRPQSVEREATHRAISHAELTDVPIMVVHVSGREPMEQIRWAQQRGLKVYGETCPQYVALTADDLKGLNMDASGGKYVCSPPPRDAASWEAIWEGIRTGVFQTFSSDHCPFFYEGEMGKLNPKARTSFRWVPNGIPGVETRLQILFSKGVVEGRISLNEFVALTSTNHAKMYGLYPKKGSIAPGFDADIVLWDPNRKETIRQELMHHGADYTPYEGLAVTGWPVMTLLRGKVVAEEGKILGALGDGGFLKRALSPYAVPAGGA
ncbi:dihydropyrimidinase [Ancylobacter novellus DSM 506]|uniref:Dihydropyrimidinase n=1 Tax=Ancylobacter novellus (strain ATCC 8093 / DSM 506 / JCM 20403 / CCM 1077 / IAM 12100 / NBRC 12443 / NCIMB 10456) TaxID=639283 RepID=D7A2K2_ANCN5|nr:dihydropyrimidinase [Ancylobacter novellus]ADH91532.1 dihydropyrimidinase [Ancylobacter novellus DSM 506]